MVLTKLNVGIGYAPDWITFEQYRPVASAEMKCPDQTKIFYESSGVWVFSVIATTANTIGDWS